MRSVNHPFDEKFVEVPYTEIFAFMAPAMTSTLGNLRFLADTIESAGSKTHSAIADSLDRSADEVAARALLAGADKVYANYRSLFRALGADLRSSIDGIADAWAVFGSTGRWTCPPDRRPYQQSLRSTMSSLPTVGR